MRPPLAAPKFRAPTIGPIGTPAGGLASAEPKNSVQPAPLVRARPSCSEAEYVMPTLAGVLVSVSGFGKVDELPATTVPVTVLISSTSMLMDVNVPLVVPNVKVASRLPGGQYSSIQLSTPWPSGPTPEQLVTQERNGNVAPTTAPTGLIVPVPLSRNFQE